MVVVSPFWIASGTPAQRSSAEASDTGSRPLDQEAIFSSVAKTGHAVVVHEGHLFGGLGGEIAARIGEACFDFLDGPVLRVANREVPQPYATNLEKLVVPNPERIAAAVRDTLGRS